MPASPSSWRPLLRALGADVDGDDVTLRFDSGRKQTVRITESDDVIEVSAIVARAAAVADIDKDQLALRLWNTNRVAQLVSFAVDARGRVCARGWVPRAGLTAEELQLVVRRVAAESDRMEFLLTGKDVE